MTDRLGTMRYGLKAANQPYCYIYTTLMTYRGEKWLNDQVFEAVLMALTQTHIQVKR